MVLHWTADQLVKRSILHLRHDSNRYPSHQPSLSLVQYIPTLQNCDLKHHSFIHSFHPFPPSIHPSFIHSFREAVSHSFHYHLHSKTTTKKKPTPEVLGGTCKQSREDTKDNPDKQTAQTDGEERCNTNPDLKIKTTISVH